MQIVSWEVLENDSSVSGHALVHLGPLSTGHVESNANDIVNWIPN